MRTTPFERHWRWCQQVRRAHRQAPEAAERDALTGGEVPLIKTGGKTLTTIYPSLNGIKSTHKKVAYVIAAPHAVLRIAHGNGSTDPYATCVHKIASKIDAPIWTHCDVSFEEDGYKRRVNFTDAY